jgi:hypothetical protein
MHEAVDAMSPEPTILSWHRFDLMTSARSAFPAEPCLYVIADRHGRALRIGVATMGLNRRYRGGTGGAIDAAMHGSGNRVYVAPVPGALAVAIESSLIWEHRDGLPYNRAGKLAPPLRHIAVVHAGDAPLFGP